jgi:alpha-ribazole phosphatase
LKIKLIRHTPPCIEAGICYGFTDLDINGDFDTHLLAIQSRLNGFVPDLVFSSPLQRCHKLATALYPTVAITHDPRLKEMNFGQWEMKPWDAIPVETLTQWSDGLWDFQPPGGESFGEFNGRVMAFFQWMLQYHRGEQIAVVTHSGVIRCMLMHCLQIPVSHIFNLDLQYSCVVEVLHTGDGNYRVKM